MVGVLIVILSLMASAGLGVITNIETETVTKNVDEYVADITGAFESDREQSYADYNPSSNYNGYTNNTVSNTFAVDFNESVYTNNYPISYSGISGDSSTYTSILSFNDITTTSSQTDFCGPGYTRYDREYWDRDPDNAQNVRWREYSSVEGPRYTGDSIKQVNLYSIFTKCIEDGTTVLGTAPSTIEITIPYTVRQMSTTFNWTYHPISGFASIYYLDNNIVLLPSSTELGTYLPSPYSWDYLNQMGPLATYSMVLKYVPLGNTQHLFTAYIGDTPVYTGSSDNYTMFYAPEFSVKKTNSVEVLGGQEGISPHYEVTTTPIDYGIDTTLPLSVHYSADTLTKHIDTRYGIGIRNGESVTWSNGQQNGVTTLTYSVWNGATNTFEDTGSYYDTATLRYYNTDETDTFTISRSAGKMYVSLNAASPVEIGTWNQAQIVLNNLNGTLTVYPISSWDNFNDYSLFGTSIVVGNLKQYNLSSIDWTANNSFRLQVTNTQIFFNNYGVVMIDPHITVSDLWPNYDQFMLDMSKVATVGTTITIGNVTYPIVSNMLYTTITEGGETRPISTGIDVTDMQLHYTKADEGWNVNITSGKNELSLNVPTTYIGMVGTWYFSMGFYQTVSKEVQERTWDPTTYDWYASHLFFWMAGILLLFSILAYKMGYLDGLSILILIVTEVILIIIGGTT